MKGNSPVSQLGNFVDRPWGVSEIGGIERRIARGRNISVDPCPQAAIARCSLALLLPGGHFGLLARAVRSHPMGISIGVVSGVVGPGIRCRVPRPRRAWRHHSRTCDQRGGDRKLLVIARPSSITHHSISPIVLAILRLVTS
jgi:hypothetical protein